MTVFSETFTTRAGTGRKFVPGYPKPSTRCYYFPLRPLNKKKIVTFPVSLYLLINPDLAKKGKHCNVLQFITGEIIEIDDDEQTEYCD